MSPRGSRRESAYQLIAHDLRTQILKNRGADGDGGRLATEAELAERYGVSRQTVRRAFQDLVSEGLVYRVPGRGTFPTRREGQYVRQFGSIDDLNDFSGDTELEVIDGLKYKVDPAAASRLRLDSDGVWTVVFRRVRQGAPFCVTTVYLPPDVGAMLTDVDEFVHPGAGRTLRVAPVLDARLERPIAEAEQSVTVSEAPRQAATALGCGLGDPVLRLDRLYYDTAEQPVELAVGYFLPDSYSYRVRFKRTAT